MRVRMRLLIMTVAVLTATPTFAQQASHNEQALGAKLMIEIQSGLGCSANLIGVQAELAKAQARIKDLEAKPEEKK